MHVCYEGMDAENSGRCFQLINLGPTLAAETPEKTADPRRAHVQARLAELQRNLQLLLP